jgi:hypothetical protein
MTRLARRIALGLVGAGWGPPAEGAWPLRLERVAPLDSRRRLYVVRCGGRRLLLLVGGPTDVALGWLPDDPIGAPPP